MAALRRIGNNLLGRKRTTKTSGGILGSTAFRHTHLRLTELGRFCTRTRASTLTRRRLLRFGFSMNTPHVHRTSEPDTIVAYDRTGRRKGKGNRGNDEVKNKTEPGCVKWLFPPCVLSPVISEMHAKEPRQAFFHRLKQIK